MQTTYRVRIWKIEVYRGKRATTYTVRWTVDGAEKRSPHANFPLADAFRSELKQAMSRGEPFDVESGLPLSMLKRASTTTTWYDFATAFVDAKWTRSAGFTRKNRAEALMTVTVALLRAKPTEFKPIDVRIALRTWAFNTALREDAPTEVATILNWVRRNSPTMNTWADPATVRDALDAVATTLDGKPAAGSSVRRKRSVLYNALEYAAVRGIIDNNPIRSVESTPVKTIRAIDKRCVINPAQARELLGYIERRPWGGRRKHAFLATLYYAGLRPEEAAALKVRDLTLPAAGWGEILVPLARPEAGSNWTDSGTPYDTRQLKARAVGETRPVPAHPVLVAILRDYVQNPGSLRAPQPSLKPGNRLFSGAHGGELSGEVYRRAWASARKAVLSDDDYDSPLGRRVYDLRHTCLTTWLNSGVPPARVAEWAGNSVPVLLATYAKCISGDEDDLKRRIEAVLPPE